MELKKHVDRVIEGVALGWPKQQVVDEIDAELTSLGRICRNHQSTVHS